MSLVLTLESGDSKLVKKLSHSDVVTMSVLREHLPDEMATCFGTNQFGEVEDIDRAKLKKAANKCMSFLKKNKKLLPITFQTAHKSFKKTEKQLSYTSGTLSGLRLPDDGDYSYSMTASLNTCLLEKMHIDHDGIATVVERRDMRDEKELLTTNQGVISIRSRTVKTTLAKALQDIVQFAGKLPKDTIHKTVC